MEYANHTILANAVEYTKSPLLHGGYTFNWLIAALSNIMFCHKHYHAFPVWKILHLYIVSDQSCTQQVYDL